MCLVTNYISMRAQNPSADDENHVKGIIFIASSAAAAPHANWRGVKKKLCGRIPIVYKSLECTYFHIYKSKENLSATDQPVLCRVDAKEKNSMGKSWNKSSHGYEINFAEGNLSLGPHWSTFNCEAPPSSIVTSHHEIWRRGRAEVCGDRWIACRVKDKCIIMWLCSSSSRRSEGGNANPLIKYITHTSPRMLFESHGIYKIGRGREREVHQKSVDVFFFIFRGSKLNLTISASREESSPQEQSLARVRF